MTRFHRNAVTRWASALALLTVSAVASATTYYASPTGSAGVSGTDPDNPTVLGKATSLAAGDTLILKDGTYQRDTPLYPHAGTSGAWVTIKRAEGAHPVIDGHSIDPNRSDKNTVGLGSYTIWDGIDLKDGVNANLATWGSSHIVIMNTKSTGAWNAGILIGQGTRNGTPGTPSTDLPGSTDITVQDCIITDCCKINASRTAAHWTPALQLFQANNVSIQRCNVYQNYGEGIGFRTVSQSTITDCTSNDNYSVEIYMDNSAYITITNSSCTASLSGYYRNSHPAIGLLCACEPLPVVGGVTELYLGINHISDSGGSYSGSPGRQFHRYSYDTWSDCNWVTPTNPPSTCSFTSTYTGLDGFPSVLNTM